MAVKLSPLFNDAQLDSSGNPYVGAQLFTYAAGSTTKQTAYQDSGSVSQHTNPIILNARGEPPAPIWLTEGSSYKLYLTTPTDSDPPVTSVRVIDNVRGVNDATVTIDEWVSSGLTPTYVSATSFTLSGDQTTEFHEGRRLKITDSGGSKYVTVTTSAFGALTTVTVAGDSLASPTSAVDLSLLRANNPSASSEMIHRKGTAVASAATCDIWNTQGDFVHITGTTGISSFGTAPYNGSRKKIIHDGALTITHGTNLKCPGDQDLVVAANTVYEVIADTTTAHRIVDVTHAFSRPAQFMPKHIAGLTYANNAGDATNDLDIAIGSCRDSTDAMDMVLASALTKQSDAAWAVGTNQGALDNIGSAGNNDFYIHLIKRSDTGVVDVLFSLSSTSPAMPTNYDYRRLIGWFKRAGGTIVAFHTYELEGGGLELTWDVPTLDINLANTLTTSRRTDAVKVPLNFATEAHLNVIINDASSGGHAWLCCPDQTDAAPSASAAPLANIGSSGGGDLVSNESGQFRIRTSATGTIAARSTIATMDLYVVSTMGFKMARRI